MIKDRIGIVFLNGSLNSADETNYFREESLNLVAFGKDRSKMKPTGSGLRFCDPGSSELCPKSGERFFCRATRSVDMSLARPFKAGIR